MKLRSKGTPMRALLRLELRRALGNRLFAVSLSVGLVFALAAAVSSIGRYELFAATQSTYTDRFVNQFSQGAYVLWMPMSVLESLPNLFFFVAVLLVGLAYSWSFRADVRSGYAQSVMARTTRARFYGAKACAAFVAGGTVVVVPLLVNFLIIACFVPLGTPDVVDVMVTAVWHRVFLSDVFYYSPPVYIALRCALDFCLAGAWATVVLAVSLLARNLVGIVVGPYVALLVVKYVSETLYMLSGVDWGSLTVLDHLKSRGDTFYYSGWNVLAFGLLMVSVAVAVPLLSKRRDVL